MGTPVPVDPHAGDWYPHGEVREFCKGNIIDRGQTACCAKACGQCGGSHCANAPGGAKQCCHEDQCLPMCPLHPGCSIIWEARGLDYEAVRKEYNASILENRPAVYSASPSPTTDKPL